MHLDLQLIQDWIEYLCMHIKPEMLKDLKTKQEGLQMHKECI